MASGRTAAPAARTTPWPAAPPRTAPRSRNQRAFLMNYNERTGDFGTPRFYNYGNAPALFTHFDGITAVPGGFNLATISSAQASSMAFVPATGGNWPSFGTATWYPIDVAASRLCSARRLQHGDREHRVPEPGDGTLRAAV